MLETYDFLRQWLPNNIFLGHNELTEFRTIFRHLIHVYLRYFIEYFPYLNITELNFDPFEADCLASSFVFFFISVLYIAHQPNWGDKIDAIVKYNILYPLIDHYLDSDKITQNILHQMMDLIETPSNYNEVKDPILWKAGQIYYDLVSTNPKIEEGMYELFSTQVAGLYLQRSHEKDLTLFSSIAREKGYRTMKILEIISDNQEDEIINTMGNIIQLLDDSVDVLEDRKNNIRTIATLILERDGVLDEIWTNIAQEIKEISGEYPTFTIFFVSFLVYLPLNDPELYSGDIVEFCQNSNYYPITEKISEKLTDSIYSEFIHKIEKMNV